ncbi:MAG: YicC family protein [Clostridiales bacterium]|nr:YicC family protein [Clostridiales bacterium]
MQSMTGYGRCRACRDGREMTIELKAVNHRFLDIAFRMPKNLTFLEDVLRDRLNHSGVKRGHVDVFVTYANTRADAREVRVDETLLAAFSQALHEARHQLEPYRKATVAEALTLSGALSIVQAEEDAAAVDELAQEAFQGALEALIDMRQREGAHLAEDLRANVEQLRKLRQRILERAPEVPREYRERLAARLEEWQVGADPQRVAQEVAIMADRCAIDEELNRLESHIAQFLDSVENGGEVGRRLDFLIQEMNREVNTIGSKASDAQIAQCVVDAKCVIEKLREQVQNAV